MAGIKMTFEEYVTALVFSDNNAKWKIETLKKAILDYHDKKRETPDRQILFALGEPDKD